jgi:mevalonate kinase
VTPRAAEASGKTPPRRTAPAERVSFAPGKVILLGEHAVVYGVPALAGALAAGVRVQPAAGEPTLRVPAWGVAVAPGETPPLARAYRAILEALEIAAPPCAFEVQFELPTGAGLGSSAALSVALVRALGRACGRTLGRGDELRAAMAAESVFHGRASGIDHAVAAHGGFGRFTRAEGFQPLPAPRPIRLAVGHTGRARDTQGRVLRVAEIERERPDETRARFAAIGELVAQAEQAIARGDLPRLGAAMDANQRALEALEVSCPEIESLCVLARGVGALGAKLTGGGGGGCVIALAPGREEAVLEAWRGAGHDAFVTDVGAAAPGSDA